MHQKNAAVFTVLAISIALASKVTAQGAPRSEAELTFAETVYVRLSGACRALVDLQHNSLNSQNEIIKTMKMTFLHGTMSTTFPINEAYQTLTKPSMFDITKQTKIIIHGYKDSSHSSVSQDLAEAYNEKKIFNVMLVDAEEMMNKRYFLSVHNSRLIGKRLANLLANLESFGANADDFHLLGISLGAHIAGWAGKYFRQYKRRSLGHITGLDPAGPCFSYAYADQRLDKSDATYVDIVHSNRLVQGIIEPLGHVDFYINGGGPSQPGCMVPSCSHLRAANVYAESIKVPKSFVGIRCQSLKHFEGNACEDKDYAVLGYGSPTSTRGLYYLRTSASSPFGLGMEGTKYIQTPMNKWFMNLNFN